MEEFEDVKAFRILWQALDDEKIKSFSFKSDTAVFLIKFTVGDYVRTFTKFKDYDDELEEIELYAEEIVDGKLDKEIERLEHEYYQDCEEAWIEEYGYEKPLLKHYYANGQLCTDYL